MEEENRNKLKIGIGAAAVVLTIGALAGFTLKDGGPVTFGQPVYANTSYIYQTQLRLRNGAKTNFSLNGKQLDATNTDYYYTLTWPENTSQFYIYDNTAEQYLGYNSGTDIATKQDLWTINDGKIVNVNTPARGLLFRKSTNIVKVYAVSNLNNTEYYATYFYTQSEYDARESICNWSDNAKTCLTNLIYNVVDPTDVEPEQSSSEPVISSSESSSTSESTSTSESGQAESTVIFNQSDLAVQTQTITKGGITLTNSSDYGSTVVTELRVYKNKTLTISGPTMTSIEFTCTASGTTKQGPGCFGAGAPSGYTYNNNTGTWTGSTDSVSFTATDNQVRITQIVVTLA